MSRCRIIALASAKGSPGASFISAGLGGRLAALGLDVLLIDADAEDHALATMLDLAAADRPQPLNQAAALGAITPEGLRGAACSPARNLQLVEAPVSEQLDGRVLVTAAREAGFSAVVADLGHHLGRLQRQVAAASDWLVWVVAPDRLGLERADWAIRRSELASGSMGLVFNRTDRAAVPGAEKVLSDRHGLPVMARLPEDRRAALGLRRRRPAHAQRAFRGPLDELARAVHPDLSGRSRSLWP